MTAVRQTCRHRTANASVADDPDRVEHESCQYRAQSPEPRALGPSRANRTNSFTGSFDGLCKIVLVHLDSHEVQPEFCGGDRRAPESEKGIHRRVDPRQAVELEAELRHAGRERGRVGTIFVATL